MVLILAASSVAVGTLNLMSREDSGVEWILTDFKGWGTPGGTLAPKQKTRQHGAWGGLSYAKARPLVVEGVCTAPTAALASDALDRLTDACSLDEAVLTVVEGGRSRWCTARRDGDIDPVWMGATAFSYSVQLVALDPRKFSAPITRSTALPSSSGGLTIPYTIPYTIPRVQTTGQLSIFNAGNEIGPVTMRLDGPCVGPVITHIGSGLSSVFAASAATLGVGEWWDIDMEGQSVLAQGYATRAQWITSRQWSGLEPGNNTWSWTAASAGAGALLTITATPADK